MIISQHRIHSPHRAVFFSLPVRKFPESLHLQLADSLPAKLPIIRHLLVKPKPIIQQRIKLPKNIPFPILQQEAATILGAKPQPQLQLVQEITPHCIHYLILFLLVPQDKEIIRKNNPLPPVFTKYKEKRDDKAIKSNRGHMSPVAV